MTENVSQKLDKVIQIDEDKIHQHLGELVRGTVEETLNNRSEPDRPPTGCTEILPSFVNNPFGRFH